MPDRHAIQSASDLRFLEDFFECRISLTFRGQCFDSARKPRIGEPVGVEASLRLGDSLRCAVDVIGFERRESGGKRIVDKLRARPNLPPAVGHKCRREHQHDDGDNRRRRDGASMSSRPLQDSV